MIELSRAVSEHTGAGRSACGPAITSTYIYGMFWSQSCIIFYKEFCIKLKVSLQNYKKKLRYHRYGIGNADHKMSTSITTPELSLKEL